MPRRPALLTEAEVKRAIRAARKEGCRAVEIKPDGTIRVELSPPLTFGGTEEQLFKLGEVVL